MAYIEQCPVCKEKKGFSTNSMIINNDAYTIIQCNYCKNVIYSIKDELANAIIKSVEFEKRMENQGI